MYKSGPGCWGPCQLQLTPGRSQETDPGLDTGEPAQETDQMTAAFWRQYNTAHTSQLSTNTKTWFNPTFQRNTYLITIQVFPPLSAA